MTKQKCVVEVEDAQSVTDGMVAQVVTLNFTDADGKPYGTFTAPGIAPEGVGYLMQDVLQRWVNEEKYTFESWCKYTGTAIPNKDVRVVLRMDGVFSLEMDAERNRVGIGWDWWSE